MKIKLSPEKESLWGHWFAWHPVFTQDGYFVWLERVKRKLIRADFDPYWIYTL